MNNRKKIIITIILILLLITPIVFFIYQRHGTEFSIPLTQRDKQFKIPEINKEISKQNAKIMLDLNENNFEFPEELDLITYEPTIVDEKNLKSIAENLSFQSVPRTTEDYFDGKKISYSDSISYLSASIEKGYIDYSLYKIPEIGYPISENEIIQNAINFLESSEITETNDKIVSGVSYFKTVNIEDEIDPAEKEDADIYQVNFTPNVSKYPILTLNPENTYTYVRVTIDGTILRATTQRLKSVRTTETVQIKSYQEVINSINDATIVSINGAGKFNEGIPENSITSINLNEVSLAYLQLQEESIVQPIFLFKGFAEIEITQDTVPIIVYLPAISKN